MMAVAPGRESGGEGGMDGFWMLVLAAALWVGVHVGIAGTRVRAALAARLGEGAFRGVFSLLSVLAIVLLVAAWRAAPTTPLWHAPGWLRWLLAALMLPAFVLFVASLRRNPTADRKSVVQGKSVGLGGSRIIKKEVCIILTSQ